jgi:hypothetical protein
MIDPRLPWDNEPTWKNDTALDIAEARQSMAVYDAEVDGMVSEAKVLVVSNPEAAQAAVALAGQAKALGKKIEAVRVKAIEEPMAYVKQVNALARFFLDRLVLDAKKTNQESVEGILKKKIGDYQYKAELARREAERMAQEEVKALQARLDAEAAKTGIEAPTVVAPVIQQEKVIRSETGASSHSRTTWKGEIVDAASVPREYCSPDQKKINEAIKMGVREIPGVRIFEDVQTILRA